jgi:hypothetical protein
MGLAIPATSITIMSKVDEATAGLASGVLSTAHEVGAALGTAVLSAIAVSAGSGPTGGVQPCVPGGGGDRGSAGRRGGRDRARRCGRCPARK